MLDLVRFDSNRFHFGLAPIRSAAASQQTQQADRKQEVAAGVMCGTVGARRGEGRGRGYGDHID